MLVWQGALCARWLQHRDLNDLLKPFDVQLRHRRLQLKSALFSKFYCYNEGFNGTFRSRLVQKITKITRRAGFASPSPIAALSHLLTMVLMTLEYEAIADHSA